MYILFIRLLLDDISLSVQMFSSGDISILIIADNRNYKRYSKELTNFWISSRQLGVCLYGVLYSKRVRNCFIGMLSRRHFSINIKHIDAKNAFLIFGCSGISVVYCWFAQQFSLLLLSG